MSKIKIYKISKLSGIAGIWQIMYIIKNIVDKSYLQRDIKDFTVSLIKDVDPRDTFNQAKIIFYYLRDHYKYIRDYHNIEELNYPAVLIKEILTKKFFYGDCDDATILVCCLFKSIGIPVRICVVAPKEKIYSHIYPQVFVDNEWITLDLTALSKPMGYTPNTYLDPLILEL